MSVSRSHRRIRLAGCAVHGQLVLELDFLVAALPHSARSWRRAEQIQKPCAGEAAQAVALRAVFFFPGLPAWAKLCRASGAVLRKFQIENFRFQMEATAKDKVAGGRPSQLRVSKAVTRGRDLFSAAFSAELDFPRLKPIYEFTSFRWTEVQLPLLKQGAPTQRQQIRESSVKRSASLAPARRRRYEEQSKATTRTKQQQEQSKDEDCRPEG
jgi:hypothetical protein